MSSSPAVPSTATKDLTINSLVKVSDDEEILAPPGALLATLAEMQAKDEALQYHVNVKITVLNVITKCLNSTVLRQAASTEQTLQYTKELISLIRDLFKELRNHPLLQEVLITEGATHPEELYINNEEEEVEAPLVLPKNPVNSLIC